MPRLNYRRVAVLVLSRRLRGLYLDGRVISQCGFRGTANVPYAAFEEIRLLAPSFRIVRTSGSGRASAGRALSLQSAPDAILRHKNCREEKWSTAEER